MRGSDDHRVDFEIKFRGIYSKYFQSKKGSWHSISACINSIDNQVSQIFCCLKEVAIKARANRLNEPRLVTVTLVIDLRKHTIAYRESNVNFPNSD